MFWKIIQKGYANYQMDYENGFDLGKDTLLILCMFYAEIIFPFWKSLIRNDTKKLEW